VHILIINFNLKDTTVSEYEDLCNQMAGAFAQVPGLLSKVWLADRDANVFGGIYTWRDEAALRAYEATELYQNVLQHPNFANIRAREFAVIEAPTRITNGTPVSAAA
jgi:quinol monooxygenase YgiN